MLNPLDCLNRQEPIDDFAALSLHVAQLTGVIEFLLQRVEELERDD